nr:hypothetical protein [Brevibacterium sp. 68QC2CO]
MGDLSRFTYNQITSRDIDPLYPILARLIDTTGASREQAAWLCVHYLTFYNIASALEVWLTSNMGPAAQPPRKLPCATERRGNRAESVLLANMRGWVNSARAAGSLNTFLFDGLPTSRAEAWREFRRRVESVPGNGRWASYKLAEIALEVLSAPFAIGDMAHKDSSGPRKGMRLIFPNAPTGNSAEDVAELDRLGRRITSSLAESTGLPVRVEHAETMLCDFNALTHGDYYTGRDIDVMLSVTLAAPEPMRGMILQARHESLPHAYLGELNGWTGPDKARKRVFKETGKLVTR